MSLTIKQLNELSEDELEMAHDRAAEHTVVGTDYWMEEIQRRSRDRSTAASIALAKRGLQVAVVSSVISVLALGVTVVALFR